MIDVIYKSQLVDKQTLKYPVLAKTQQTIALFTNSMSAVILNSCSGHNIGKLVDTFDIYHPGWEILADGETVTLTQKL